MFVVYVRGRWSYFMRKGVFGCVRVGFPSRGRDVWVLTYKNKVAGGDALVVHLTAVGMSGYLVLHTWAHVFRFDYP